MVYNTRSYARIQRLNTLNENFQTKIYNVNNVNNNTKGKTKTKTNNQNYTELEVNIDFDHASKEWRKNKIKLKEGMFRYM